MIRACASTRTVLGFVCAAWSWTFPPRRIRLPEVERRRRLVALRAAEGDRVADDSSDDQARGRRATSAPRRGGRSGRSRPPAPPRVERVFGLAHPAATLAEAQGHIASKPSRSATRGSQPSAARMRVTSAFVRETSPWAARHAGRRARGRRPARAARSPRACSLRRRRRRCRGPPRVRVPSPPRPAETASSTWVSSATVSRCR